MKRIITANEQEKYYFKGDFEIIGDTVVSYKGKDSSVTIPNSVTSIGNYAFAWCTGLTSITIPNSVTSIGDYAFAYCESLISIIIPNSVTTIGYRAFWGCKSLKSITVPNSVTSIGDMAFEGCTNLIAIKIPERFKNEVTLKEIGFDNYQIYLILNKKLKKEEE